MNRGSAMLALGAVAVGVGVVVLGAAATPQGRQVAQHAAGQLGRFFTWAELTASSAAARLGLDNTPTAEAQQALQVVVRYILDPLRQAFGSRLRVTSGYRSPAVNEAVDGSATSQHMKGEAVDLVVDGYTAQQVATVIARAGIPFDQLIWYAPKRGGHVHVSLSARKKNRGEILHAPAAGGYVASALGRA